MHTRGTRPGSRPVLHHRIVGEDDAPRTLYVLPGIFGAGRNWGTVARRVVRDRPDWSVVLVDLRLHGRSLGFTAPHTIAACASDVAHLVNRLSRPADAVLGHSFGGKVALAGVPALVPLQAWVVDSTPSARPPGGDAVRMLEVLRRLPGRFASRDDAVSALESAGLDPGVARWMATNLRSVADHLEFPFDLDGMEALLDSFFTTDLWGLVEGGSPTKLHFIKATRSGVLTPEDQHRLRAAPARVRLHEVDGGHWVHADNPVAIVDLLTTSLPSSEALD